MVADLVVIKSTRPDRGTALEEALVCRARALLTGHLDLGCVLSVATDVGDSAVVFDGYPSAWVLRQISDAVERTPELGVVVIGPVASRLDVLVSLASGVSGYVAEPGDPATVADAVDSVLRGELYLPPDMSRELVRATLSGLRGVTVHRRNGQPVTLTGREWEVLVQLRQGRTTAEIADRLVVAKVTVRTHAFALLHKLGLSSRAELSVDGGPPAGDGRSSAVS
jgi:DNA-binding NarL/FixJ family response regulator